MTSHPKAKKPCCLILSCMHYSPNQLHWTHSGMPTFLRCNLCFWGCCLSHPHISLKIICRSFFYMCLLDSSKQRLLTFLFPWESKKSVLLSALSHAMCYCPINILTTLHWIHTSVATSILSWEAHKQSSCEQPTWKASPPLAFCLHSCYVRWTWGC